MAHHYQIPRTSSERNYMPRPVGVMLSLGQTLANAAGLRPRKKFHFEVVFKLEELLNCTYVSGVLFAKIRLKEGGHFSYSSQRLALTRDISFIL